jgi:hypothetical protein
MGADLHGLDKYFLSKNEWEWRIFLVQKKVIHDPMSIQFLLHFKYTIISPP